MIIGCISVSRKKVTTSWSLSDLCSVFLAGRKKKDHLFHSAYWHLALPPRLFLPSEQVACLQNSHPLLFQSRGTLVDGSRDLLGRLFFADWWKGAKLKPNHTVKEAEWSWHLQLFWVFFFFGLFWASWSTHRFVPLVFPIPRLPWYDNSCLQLDPNASKLEQRPTMWFVVFRHAGHARPSWVWSAVLSTAYSCGCDRSCRALGYWSTQAPGVCQSIRNKISERARFRGNKWTHLLRKGYLVCYGPTGTYVQSLFLLSTLLFNLIHAYVGRGSICPLTVTLYIHHVECKMDKKSKLGLLQYVYQ